VTHHLVGSARGVARAAVLVALVVAQVRVAALRRSADTARDTAGHPDAATTPPRAAAAGSTYRRHARRRLRECAGERNRHSDSARDGIRLLQRTATMRETSTTACVQAQSRLHLSDVHQLRREAHSREGTSVRTSSAGSGGRGRGSHRGRGSSGVLQAATATAIQQSSPEHAHPHASSLRTIYYLFCCFLFSRGRGSPPLTHHQFANECTGCCQQRHSAGLGSAA
jgi:hypothetical protein